MSSILKALKKLEEEKTAPRNGKLDLAKGITKSASREKRRSLWYSAALMAGAAVVAASATYLLTGGFVSHKSAAPAASTSQAVVTEQTPPPALSVETGTLPPKTVRLETPSVRKRPEQPTAWPPAKPTAPAGKKVATAAAVPANGVARPSLAHEKGREVSAKAPEPLPSEVRQPQVTVTGIAWQKDGADRMAIVNGASVSEGMTVAGARVEAILPDRVRFVFNNRTFEIPLGRNGQ
jgi:general secretion pathway protein B